MVSEARFLFNEAVKDLFAEHPEMESFSWAQYTPYFNDGDECVFGVLGDDPDINGIDGYSIEPRRVYGKSVYEAEHGELVPAKQAVAELLNAAPEAMMKDVFGDHMKVTVTRDGITTDEYSHD